MTNNWLSSAFCTPLIFMKKMGGQIIPAVVFGLTLIGSQANAQSENASVDIQALQEQLAGLQKSPELIVAIDKVIAELDSDVPMTSRIDLDLWKLKSLGDVSDTRSTSDFAMQIYQTYDREDYASVEQFGDTMQQLVQAFSKTKELDLALEIIQSLRESVYETPNTYLSFIIDKSRMEVYIETFDYARALETELFILGNPDYQSLDMFMAWRPYLFNEIAFLYNRLGNGEKALEYLKYAKDAFAQTDLHASDLFKAEALNYGNRGRAYLLIGNYTEAEKMGQQVLSSGQALQQNYVIALGYRLIGSAAYNLGDYDKALINLKAGIELSDKHSIATMQKYLYLDYALTYEKMGQYDQALYWQKRQFELEFVAQKSVVAARTALQSAEARALEHYTELKALRRENDTQREISVKDHRITQQLKMMILLLLMGGAVLAYSFYSLRKGQRKLVESEAKARVANAAKSDFLANMSHEIRTPMNGVLGMAEVLGMTSLNEKQKQYVDIIGKSGNNLLAIINDILDFSKIEADKLELNLATCNIYEAIGDVIALLSPSAAEKRLNVVFEYDASLHKYFVVDVVRFKQIISNLIGNAIKFTKNGSVSIIVSSVTIDGQASINIDVIDTGIGIPEDKLSTIFEKFMQAESSTTRQFGGTGLGLAISQRLAESMQGSLTAKSGYGLGSTFTFSVPLEAATALSVMHDTGHARRPVAENAREQQQQPQAKKPAVRKIKILIAEDDEINRSVVISFLKHPSIDLSVCENGAKAVEFYQAAYFDIILMDVSMPVMDGLEATQKIRAIESQCARPFTPIICLSAHAMIDDREAFIAAGMNDYLSKPLKREDLFKVIKRGLQMKKAASAQPNGNQLSRQQQKTYSSAG